MSNTSNITTAPPVTAIQPSNSEKTESSELGGHTFKSIKGNLGKPFKLFMSGAASTAAVIVGATITATGNLAIGIPTMLAGAKSLAKVLGQHVFTDKSATVVTTNSTDGAEVETQNGIQQESYSADGPGETDIGHKDEQQGIGETNSSGAGGI